MRPVEFPLSPLSLTLLPAAGWPESAPPAPGGHVSLANRQVDAECCALPHGAAQLDAAAVQFGDRFHYRQPEACSRQPRRPGVGCTDEAAEQAAELVGRDADPVIRHVNPPTPAVV